MRGGSQNEDLREKMRLLVGTDAQRKARQRGEVRKWAETVS